MSPYDWANGGFVDIFWDDKYGFSTMGIMFKNSVTSKKMRKSDFWGYFH